MSGLSRKYEMIYIHPGNLPGEDVEKVEEILNGTLAKMGGELIHREDWGVRTLAYPVRKHSEGRYILVRFACTADCLNEIERRFRINESVIKYLTVRLPDDFVQEEVAEEVEDEVTEETKAPAAAPGESTPAPAATETEAEAPAAEQKPEEENPGE